MSGFGRGRNRKIVDDERGKGPGRMELRSASTNVNYPLVPKGIDRGNIHQNKVNVPVVLKGRGRGNAYQNNINVPVVPKGMGRGNVQQNDVNVPVVLKGRGRGNAYQNNINVPVVPKGMGRGNVQQNDVNVPVVVAKGRGRPKAVAVNAVNDFVQATSSNLPTLNFMCVADYFKKMRAPELRHAKDEVSSGADYGDSAIGYVKVKSDATSCTVEAKMTPQTSVNKSPYNVSVSIEGISRRIQSTSCDCQASMGHCKHQTALVFWILRRSEEPSPTEVACYWRKSHLSTVKGIKTKSIDELSGVCTDISGHDDSVLRKFIEIGERMNKDSTIVRYSDKNILEKKLYMDHLYIRFAQTQQEFSCTNFLTFCQNEMTDDKCEKVFDETLDQSSKAQWYYLRFGRITASKLYEASRCDTTDGSLVAALMGSRAFKGNVSTKRGQTLEIEIFDLLKAKYKDIKKCGIVLTKDFPQFGASPDGLSDQYVFEIKCPSKKKTIKNYIENGKVKDKVYFQIQMQMLMCRKQNGILVVADPEFEKNKKITEMEVPFDEAKLKDVMKNAKKFWEKAIFPILK